MSMPRRRSSAPDGKEAEPFHVTQEGLDRLKDRLAYLKRIMPERAEEARRTAAYGDRSENDAYKTAKGALRRTKWQILEIEDQIKRAVIIETGAGVSAGVVRIGSTVTVAVNGETKTFQIVGSHETDPAQGRISFQSPLGAALLGRKKGDEIEVKVRDQAKRYSILQIQ